MPETRFQRWLRLSRLSTQQHDQQQQQQRQQQQQDERSRRHGFMSINSFTKWLLFLQSVFQQISAYHCLYKSIRDIGNGREDVSSSESIFHLLICTGILVSLIVDLISVTSNNLSVANSSHWPVGVCFFIFAFLDQLLNTTNIFINGTRLQKECGDRIFGSYIGGKLQSDHFIYSFCEMRREMTQIWSLLGFFIHVLLCIMYSITANTYATHRVSLLTRLHQQQQPNNNIPLYTISDPPTERMPDEPNTPNVPAPPYTSVNSNPHNVELNR